MNPAAGTRRRPPGTFLDTDPRALHALDARLARP